MKGPFLCPRAAAGCVPRVEGKAAMCPGWGEEVEAGGEGLESPEDKRTAATAGAGRRGRGHRCLSPAAASLAFMETVQRRGLGSLLSPSALLSYSRGPHWCSWGPGLGAGRPHVTGTPGTLSLTQQLIMGSQEPFVITAAIPWVDGVDLLPPPLPQPCRIPFVSEGNRGENVTLQMEKLQALPV